VMRPLCWLHTSDIHMRVSATWSQDVVLRAMCEDVAKQRKDGISADFILATGDLAFSGKAEEYKLAGAFFDALSDASGVPKDRIFCIPGNHDIDRDRQKMCFLGARNQLQSQNQIDLLLSPDEDLQMLLKRQENFRTFQTSYFTGQDRTWTQDGLGYVSCLTIEDVRVSIVAMDSAWLAEGGLSDHGRLLIGERQVINAVDLAAQSEPHIVIGMAHHPFHLLQDFDRRCVQNRIERSCLFFHCGHLHAPESRAAGFNSGGCLTLAAGASFETRQHNNSYSFVALDLVQGQRKISTIQYHPASGTFLFAASEQYPVEIAPSGTCSVDELAQAITVHSSSLSSWAHYLSALLLGKKSDLPISAPGGNHVFGSFDVLIAESDDDLRRKTLNFMAFRNLLRVFYKRVSLSDILNQYGIAVQEYGNTLEARCNVDPKLRGRLNDQEKDARTIGSAAPQTFVSHTGALFGELAEAREWGQLRAQAERHIDSTDQTVALQAKRMLALSLANSSEASDKSAALALYRSLSGEKNSEAIDTGNLATLLTEAGEFDDAKFAVLAGIEKFAGKEEYFSQIGLRLVEATGDREFRKTMEAKIKARGRHD
jgi:hypothetical protein